MLQSFKKISLVLLLACGLQTSWAFSLLGPDGAETNLPTGFGDAWQTEIIGYNGPRGTIDPLAIGPKNIGEAYRHNTPVMYYACDANFLNFFGANGAAAIDSAFEIVNTSLTNVNAFSAALNEFPLNSLAANYQASALGLVDLKSETLTILMEQLGLVDSVRYVWCLHNRFQTPNATPTCPFNMQYQVIMRNFDITASPLNQVQYSPYVNASLYTYVITEACTGPNPLADASEYLVDPLQNNPPVAASDLSALTVGSFFTGLTRDDMAGLRYLLDTNNVAFESPAAGSVLLNSSGPGGTNYGAPFVLYTSDLTTFILAARTNAPATLTNLYPGLIVTSFAPQFSQQYTTNYVAYYTNLIGAPAGSQTLVVVPVVTYSILTTYAYTFANIITNKYKANASTTILTVQVAPQSGAPVGSPLKTNVTATASTLTGVPSGDFYINTNVCGPNLILTNYPFPAVATTNLIYAASNSAGLFTSQSLVIYSNTTALIVQPIVCGAAAVGGTATNSPGLYRGMGKVQYVKTTYDSLIGQFYQPITNTYPGVLIINSKPINQTFQRVLIQPDYLVTAADLLPGPSAINNVEVRYARSVDFDFSNIGHNLAGPGVIVNPAVVFFNKVGPVYLNHSTAFLNQTNGTLDTFIWGSFDGSTNDPVVYPNGTSLTNLANQVLVQVSPATLPVGTRNVAYPATAFIATGGAFSPPYTWSLSFGSLPAGLALSSGGTISGTPTQAGTFDFTVQLTDSLSRAVTWSYSITIN